MEKQIHKKDFKYSNQWWIGAVLIFLSACAIWFGLHSHYRYISIALILPALSLILFKNLWHWITCGTMLLIIIFLWAMGPSGYRYASLIPVGVIVLLLTAVLLKPDIRRIIIVVATVLILITAVVEIPILISSKDDSSRGLKYIIVLGAAVYGTEPSISLRNRMDAAVKYLRKNKDTVVIVSGGQGAGEEISEAECMYRYLIHKGIEKNRILIENNSTSTMENLAFSKVLIDKDDAAVTEVGIVSSSYHLYRAKKMAESIGLNARGIPCEDGYPIYMAGMYLREAFAAVKLWTFGTIERDSCIASALSIQ